MRKRMVSPSFFSDEDLIANFDAWGRLLYVGLWCIAEDSGCFEPSPLQLKMQIFPGDNIDPKDIEKWLAKLAELNKIIFYEIAGKNYAWIKNFHKYQTLDRPSPPNIPLPDWLEWCGKEHFGNDRHKWHYKFTGKLFDDKSKTIRRQVEDVSPRKKEKKERSTSTRRHFDDMSTKEIIAKFTECIYPGITPYDIDRLTAYIEDGLEPDLIIYAIEEAAANNARRMSYIMKILDRLRAAGITTREAAEAEKAGRKTITASHRSDDIKMPYHRIVRAPRGDAVSPPDAGSAVLPDKPSPRREDADSSRDAVSLGNADFPPGQRLAEAWRLDK